METAVFVDRDGVINELPSYQFGDDKVEYITKKEQINLIPESAEAIKLLNERGLKVIVVSNQPQVARGLATFQEIEEINNYLVNLLEEKGAKVDSVYFCPHRPTKGVNEYGVDCDCRKPKPGLILKAAKEKEIDISKSYMVGDRISDIKAGNSAGCKLSIGVKTGYGCEDDGELPGIQVNNLLDAAHFILEDLT